MLSYAQRNAVVRRDRQPLLARVIDTQKDGADHRYPDEQAYLEGDPAAVAAVETRRHSHALLGVPMLKESELVGAIAIYRQEVRPFTDKQIELVTELCRPGRHRHREHAAAQRAAPAHR